MSGRKKENRFLLIQKVVGMGGMKLAVVQVISIYQDGD
uniref:Uncharacterized protein n=1 Tax=viral metagenome TaxID=1070528 RepID=A0A6C0CMI9_9ZZZZ